MWRMVLGAALGAVLSSASPLVAQAPANALAAPGGVLEPLGPVDLTPEKRTQRTQARRAIGVGEPREARARKQIGLMNRANARAERLTTQAAALQTRASDLTPSAAAPLVSLAAKKEASADLQRSRAAYHAAGADSDLVVPAAATCAAPPGPSPNSIYTLPAWSDLDGWNAESQYATVQVADVDGDGDGEVLGRDGGGIEIAALDLSTGVFGALAAGPNLDDAGGWDRPQFALTIRSGDIDGDGAAEIVALNASAEVVTFDRDPASNAWIELPAASWPGWDDAGTDWSQPEFYSTIRLVDLDGDGGAAELVARAAGGLVTARFAPGSGPGTGTWSALPSGPALDAGEPSSSIAFGELDGAPGVELVALNDTPAFEVFSFDPASGGWSALGAGMPAWADGTTPWLESGYASTVRLADLDGAPGEIDELVARSADGLVVAAWDTGIGGWTARPSAPVLADSGGWNSPGYYETLRAGDLDGDGSDELFIRAYTSLQVLEYDAGAAGGPWTVHASAPLVASAWSEPENWAFRVGDVDGDGAAEVVGRDSYGVRTFRYSNGDLVSVVAPFPTYSGAECTAYSAIEAANSGVLQGMDLRAAYGSLAIDLSSLSVPSRRPKGVSTSAWKAVAPQITRELTAAQRVRRWHGPKGMGTVITNGYSPQPGSVIRIGAYFTVAPKSSIAGEIIPWIEGIVEAIGLATAPEGRIFTNVAAAAINSILEFTENELDDTSNENFKVTQTENGLISNIATYKQQAINANTRNSAMVPREYGMLLALQDAHLPTANAPWQTMWRQSDIFFWQTFGAAFWNASECDGFVREGLNVFQCQNFVRDERAVAPLFVGTDRAYWIGGGTSDIRQPASFLTSPPAGYPPASQVLLGTPSPQCTPPLTATTAYDNTCLLGLTEEEVYRGRNGWDLPRNFLSDCLTRCRIGPSSTTARASGRPPGTG